MKRRKWQIADGPGDFLPLLIGCVMLFIATPSFLGLIFAPDEHSAGLDKALLVPLGAGILLGIGFLVLGLQLLSMPGSLVYRLAHGRIFRR